MNYRLFQNIANQVSSGVRVSRTAVNKLAVKNFTDTSTGARTIAIEQNPATGSEWAKLAREGHKVVQFKQNGRYVAVSVDGKVQPYDRNQRS